MLAGMGLACGDWIETRDAEGTRRWRLNWITSIVGTCVFKHYETNTMRNMSIDELKERLSSGEMRRVRGLGLADEVVDGAFRTASRKARREESRNVTSVPVSANRKTATVDVSHHRGGAPPTNS
jgi:hypothetical protein